MTDRELCLYYVLKHPVSFVNTFGPKGEGRYTRVRLYQAPYFLDEHGGALQGARRYGKSFRLEWGALSKFFSYPNKDQLMVALRRTHVKNVFENIVEKMNKVKFFSHFYKTGRELGSVKRDIVKEIQLSNGHTYVAIAVGDDPKATQIKGQSPFVKWVDEAQDFPNNAAEILSSTEDPQGCMEWWAGVVDGRRDSAFFNVLERSAIYKKHIYKISRRMDPNFTQLNLDKAKEQLDGKSSQYGDGENSIRFGQEIDAEHGIPVEGSWNIDDILACMTEFQTSYVNTKAMKTFRISGKEYTRGDNPADFIRGLEGNDNATILAIDMGDVQPTMIMPFTNEGGIWTCKYTIELSDRVDTQAQKNMIEHITRMFPNLVAVAVDCTTSQAMVDLLEADNPELRDKTVRVMFNASIAYAEDIVDTVEKQDAYLRQEGKKYKIGNVVEKKMKAKSFSTMQAKQMLAKREILWYYDPEIIEDFSSEVTVTTVAGDRIDTPSNVHRPEVFRCFAMAYWQKVIRKDHVDTEDKSWFLPTQISTGFFGRSDALTQAPRIDDFGGIIK